MSYAVSLTLHVCKQNFSILKFLAILLSYSYFDRIYEKFLAFNLWTNTVFYSQTI
jgi:hypothetical protein